MGHWRAIVTRESGSIVSSNVAPATRTLSVVHNLSFKMAYGGMKHFKPLEVYDLKCTSSASHPSTELGNPLCLFSENSFHGGAWRCGYKYSTIGTSAVLMYILTEVIVTTYLFLYNIFQLVGWSYVAYIGANLAKEAGSVDALVKSSPWEAV